MILPLLGLLQLGFSEGSCSEIPREPANVAVVLIIRHIGAEDRSVPPLLLYSANARMKPDPDGCAKGMSCFGVPSAILSQLAAEMNSRFFSRLSDDAGLEQAGSFEFAMEGPKSRRKLRLDKAHSSEVFELLLERVQNPPARRELERRLSVTRI